MTNLFNRLKQKWGIQSNWDFVIINIVFALAGMTIIYERKPIFHLISITAETPFIVKLIVWLLIVFPCYQINLIVFGALLGQFRFFWEKEKQMGKFLFKLFTRKKKSASSQNTHTS